MRFMLLMIPRGYERASADASPSDEVAAARLNFNAQLQQAGVLLAADDLHPPAGGARVSFDAGKPTVRDGPFPESTETLGGYWMIDVRSRAEAIEWAKRYPAVCNDLIEVRQVRPG